MTQSDRLKPLTDNSSADGFTFFEALFDLQPYASVVVDNAFMIVEGNSQAVALFGLRERSALKNHAFLRLFCDGERERVIELCKSLPKDGIGVLDDVVSNGSQDHKFHLEIVRLPENYVAHGSLLVSIRAPINTKNPSIRVTMLEAMLENTDIRAYAFDDKNRCIYANQQQLDFLSKRRDEVIGVNRESWMSSRDALQEAREDARIFTSLKARQFESQYQTDDNVTRHFLVHKFPLVDDDEVPFGVGSIATETTEFKDKEQRLSLAAIAFSMGHEGVVICDAEGNIASVNQAFVATTGYQEHEVIGKNPRMLSSGRHDDAFYKKLWNDVRNIGYWEGEIWNRRKDHSVYPEWLSITRVPGGNAPTQNYVAVFSDLTKRKLEQEHIEKLAFYDVLTGLPNRYQLAHEVRQLVSASTEKQQEFALVYLDLDHFKKVNDVYGHRLGDRLLIEVSKSISGWLRPGDSAARVGGDEFVALLTNVSPKTAGELVTALLHSLSEPVELDGISLSSDASCGVTMFPADGTDYEVLLKNADIAMNQAKRAGRPGIAFFDNVMATKARRGLRLETQLRNAITAGEFSLLYQPQIVASTTELRGAEALIRWNNRNFGHVSPSEFIPLAERTGMMEKIGVWVLDNAFELTQKAASCSPDIVISVNLSARQFDSKALPGLLEQKLSEYGINPRNIELEITESTIMKNPEGALETMRRLGDMGFLFSLDDFGTGYSSMQYLSWMPLANIKIDREFVIDVHEQQRKQLICKSIIELGHSLGMEIIAEGASTLEELSALESMGCDMIQGYVYSQPIDEARFLDTLTRPIPRPQ